VFKILIEEIWEKVMDLFKWELQVICPGCEKITACYTENRANQSIGDIVTLFTLGRLLIKY